MGDLHWKTLAPGETSAADWLGVSEYDEACLMPFTMDLVRLATSIALAAETIRRPYLQQDHGISYCRLQENLNAGSSHLSRANELTLLAVLTEAAESPPEFAQKLKRRQSCDQTKTASPRIGGRPSVRLSATQTAIPPPAKAGGTRSLGRRAHTAVARAGSGETRCAKQNPCSISCPLARDACRRAVLSATAPTAPRGRSNLLVHDRWFVRSLAPDVVGLKHHQRETSGTFE